MNLYTQAAEIKDVKSLVTAMDSEELSTYKSLVKLGDSEELAYVSAIDAVKTDRERDDSFYYMAYNI